MRQMPCHLQVESAEAFKKMLEEILRPSAEPLIEEDGSEEEDESSSSSPVEDYDSEKEEEEEEEEDDDRVEILRPSAEPLIDDPPPAYRRPLRPLPPLIHPPPPACTAMSMCDDDTTLPAFCRPLPPLLPPELRPLEEEQKLTMSAASQEVFVPRYANPQHKNLVWEL
jgi:hypothetical protein